MITTLPHDNAIVVLRTYRKHQSDRMKKILTKGGGTKPGLDVFLSQDGVCKCNIVFVTRASLFVRSSSIIMTSADGRTMWGRSRSVHWWSDGVASMVRHGTRRIYTHVTGYNHSLSFSVA